MSWQDVLKERAARAADEHSTPRIFDRVRTSEWDPYDVWLTRIKQPREESNRSGTATA